MAEKIQNQQNFFDIAANIADETYFGYYNGKKYHDPDVKNVIQRALSIGCNFLLIVGGNLKDSENAFKISQQSENFFCTSGVQYYYQQNLKNFNSPCRANEIDELGGIEQYFDLVDKQIMQFNKKIAAIGECGLDYDRLNFSSKEQQIQAFIPHFKLSNKHNLPMYFHSRNAEEDFIKILKENRNNFSSAVVHSFTGSQSELQSILELGLYIGVNGCSLKSKENLELVKQIPLDKIMLETDSPYCEIKKSHAGFEYVKTQNFGFSYKKKHKFEMGQMVKGRNEPINIIQVCEVVATLHKVSVKELADLAYQNSINLFCKK